MTDPPSAPTVAAAPGPADAFQAESQEHGAAGSGATARHHPPVLRAVGGIDRHAIHWMNVEVPAGGVTLPGRLMLPPAPRGLVVVVYGGGLTRRNPGARQMAAVLNAARYATLLLDLKSPAEPWDAGALDPDTQADRLLGAVRWAATAPQIPRLRVGVVGASTAAAAVVIAAVRAPESIRAVVAYAGRPDLAAGRLSDVGAPTLLVVGGEDLLGESRNREALEALRCKARLELVPGGTLQFDGPGPLGQAARLAAAWFDEHLAAPSTPPGWSSGAGPSERAT
jgi:putative phosphoribosyl transferase